MIVEWVIGGAVAIAVILVLNFIRKTYNELIWFQIKVEKIASNLEAVLKKKYDMIPALAKVVAGYSGHEKSVFTEVARLRSQWGESKTMNEKIRIASKLEGKLAAFVSINERNPNLKANRSYQNIMRSIYYTEREVLNERKYYNEVVRRYDVRLRLFPRKLVAKHFHFEEKPFFSEEA